jgi:hypothetical protein
MAAKTTVRHRAVAALLLADKEIDEWGRWFLGDRVVAIELMRRRRVMQRILDELNGDGRSKVLARLVADLESTTWRAPLDGRPST